MRRQDRVPAAQLYERGVPLEAVEKSFVLAAARRLIRPAGAAPLGTIRSLACFSPAIEEVLAGVYKLQVGLCDWLPRPTFYSAPHPSEK